MIRTISYRIALNALVLALLVSTMNVSLVAASGYVFVEADRLEVRSGDAKAQAQGQINWFEGAVNDYIRRGNYVSTSVVTAIRPVPCIWAKVSFGYPAGSITIAPNGPYGTISGGSYEGNGWYVSCRRQGYSYPAPLKLAGIGYARAFLNSSTLAVCTSNSKAEGPRYCSWEKNVFEGN